MDASKKTVDKKSAVSKKPAQHPAYKEMIVEALRALSERTGSSRQKINLYIQTNYKVSDDETAVKRHLKLALKRAVANGAIIQSKGVGASGSFKLPASAKKPAAKKVVAKKVIAAKPAAKKPVKKTVKKSPAKKKPVVSAKKTATKSPRKPKSKVAKKPAVVKKSPAKKAKKVVKPKAKSPAARKPVGRATRAKK